MRILIIDDDSEQRRLLRQILLARAPDSKIAEAVNLCEAQALCRSADLILCDGHFPKGPAYASLEVQCNPWLGVWAYAKHLEPGRFILLSGDPRAVENARHLGIVAFPKPYRIGELLACVFQSTVSSRQSAVSDSRVANPEPRISNPATENPVVVEVNRENERIGKL